MTRLWIAMFTILSLALVACGDDGASSGGTTSAYETPAAAAAGDEEPDEAPPSGSGRGSGTLVMGDETVTVDSVFCFLEEQPRAALGGVFEFTAQARATNAAGEDLLLDVSRARPESGPTADNVIIDIGPVGDSVGYRGGGSEVVSLDGRTLTADGVTLTWFDGTSKESLEVSFEIACGS